MALIPLPQLENAEIQRLAGLFRGLAVGGHIILPGEGIVAAGGQCHQKGVGPVEGAIVGVALADDQIQAGGKAGKAGLAVLIGIGGVQRLQLPGFHPAGQRFGDVGPVVGVVDTDAGGGKVGQEGEGHILADFGYPPEGIGHILGAVAAADGKGAVAAGGVDLSCQDADGQQGRAQQHGRQTLDTFHKWHLPFGRSNDL